MPRNIAGLKRGGPGRPKGVPNKASSEAKAIATELVDDPIYRAKLKSDLQRRKVHPAIESMLWHYSKGKPTDHIDLKTREQRPLVIDSVATREEMLAALGAIDVDAGEDDDDA